jgi:hypothetical protein
MAMQQQSDIQESGPPEHGSARVLSWVSLACWTVALVLAEVWIHARPQCPDGYVRFIDVGPVLQGAGVIGVVCSAALLVRETRTTGRHRIVGGVLVVSTGLALLAGYAAVNSLISSGFGPYDNSCWTF